MIIHVLPCKEVCKSLTNSPNRVNCVIWSACVSSTPQFGASVMCCVIVTFIIVLGCELISHQPGQSEQPTLAHILGATHADHRKIARLQSKSNLSLPHSVFLRRKKNTERWTTVFRLEAYFWSNGNFIVSLKRRELKVNLRRWWKNNPPSLEEKLWVCDDMDKINS